MNFSAAKAKSSSVKAEPLGHVAVKPFKAHIFIYIFAAYLGLENVKLGLFVRPDTGAGDLKLGGALLGEVGGAHPLALCVIKGAFSAVDEFPEGADRKAALKKSVVRLGRKGQITNVTL